MKKKRIKIFFYFALFLLIGLVGFVFFIETQFQKIEQIPFTKVTSKTWSHRGYALTEKNENTLSAITLAFQKEYKGVEVDLWYNDGQFYLSHEESYIDSLPKLEDVFRIFPNRYFWLDLKNLSYSNYNEIAIRLELLEKDKKSYLIESKNALPLGLLNQKDFKTSYWVIKTDPIRQFIQKIWIVIYNYNSVSMPAKNYQEEMVRKKYKHLNIHLWDKHPSPEIYQWEEVKIVLDDNELM